MKEPTPFHRRRPVGRALLSLAMLAPVAMAQTTSAWTGHAAPGLKSNAAAAPAWGPVAPTAPVLQVPQVPQAAQSAQPSQTPSTVKTASVQRRSVEVAGVAKAPGAAVREGSPAMQDMMGGPLSASPDPSRQLAGPGLDPQATANLRPPGRRVLTTAPVQTQVDCRQRQAVVGAVSSFALASVNKRAQGFWVDQDSDETALVLHGCFDAQPGHVQLQGPFPGGTLDAQVLTWSTGVIAAKVPRVTGVPDGAISVRVVFKDGSATNARSGIFHARREAHEIELVRHARVTGTCAAQTWVPVQQPLALAVGDRNPPSKLALRDQSGCVPMRSGKTELQLPLRPGFEISTLSWDFAWGSGSGRIVTADRAVVDWQPTIQHFEKTLAGVTTASLDMPVLQFSVRVSVSGPAGLPPVGL